MNLVDVLKSQMAGEITNQLGGMLGASDADTGKLLKAGIPAILAGLGSVAAKKEGADKLALAFNGIDPGLLGNLGKMLSGADAKKGGDLLTSLLGNGMLTGLVPLLAKFLKQDSSLITKGLGLLAPLILGSVANSFKGRKIDGPGINQLFSEQKGNIISALPAGLSLAGIPGLDSLGDVGKLTGQTINQVGKTAETASGSGKLLLPLIALAAIVGGVVWFLNNGGQKVEDPARDAVGVDEQDVAGAAAAAQDTVGAVAIPGFSELERGFSEMFETVGPSLQGIKDAASAEAALPDLESAVTGLEGMTATLGGMPDVAKSAVSTMVQGQLDKLVPMIDQILGIPGIGEKVVAVLNSLKDKLSGLVIQ